MTRHQLGIEPNEEPDRTILETIRIVSGNDQLSNIPLCNCLFETSNSDQEYHDLLFFEVGVDWAASFRDAPYFAPVEVFNGDSRKMSFVFGCPTLPGVMTEYLEHYGTDFSGSIHMKTVVADCEYNADYRSNSEHYRHYRGGSTTYDMDGFSGGAVFSLFGEVGSFRLMLDGIVVRAGSNNVYIVDSDYIASALEQSMRR